MYKINIFQNITNGWPCFVWLKYFVIFSHLLQSSKISAENKLNEQWKQYRANLMKWLWPLNSFNFSLISVAFMYFIHSVTGIYFSELKRAMLEIIPLIFIYLIEVADSIKLFDILPWFRIFFESFWFKLNLPKVNKTA